MTMHPRHDNVDRLEELLCTRATQVLTPEESHELDEFIAKGVDDDLIGTFDDIAARIDLASMDRSMIEPMPDTLRQRLEDDAAGFAARARGMSLTSDHTDEAVDPAASEERDRSSPIRSIGAPTPDSATRAPRSFLPWTLAAACLLLAVVGWFNRLQSEASPATRYEAIKSSPTTMTVAWNDVENAGVRGEIVWDQAKQTGVMRFSGLDVNDPQSMQYQLWIFDAGRADSTIEELTFNAVDGGVFNVDDATGDVFIPINAKLEVFEPQLFAVTTEPPGGVVKHVTQGDYRIILTAPVPNAV